jgi:predicted homoserine dehydrogenase-like protein
VITVAKRDLKAGEVLDGIGGFTCYGVLEDYNISTAEKCLPMGLSKNCRLLKPIKKDEVISYDDIELPVGSIADKLRIEQNTHFLGLA